MTILPLTNLRMKGLNMWRYWRVKFKGNLIYSSYSYAMGQL